MQGATLQSEASARAAEGTASQGPLAKSQNADSIVGLAAYMFSGEGQIQDIYFARQLTGEEMQKRLKDEVSPYCLCARVWGSGVSHFRGWAWT